MSSLLIRPIIQVLKKIIEDLESDKYTCNDQELSQVLEELSQFNNTTRMSKAQAYEYLGISRASFDNYVKIGLIPKGEKTSGFKELSWKKEVIEQAAKDIRNQ